MWTSSTKLEGWFKKYFGISIIMSSTESVFSEQMIGEWTLKCPECSTVIQHLLKIMERITVLFYWKSESVRNSVMSNSLWHRGLEPTRLLCPWNSPGKNTGVGCHFLFQGIFLTQGWNLRLLWLLHWQANSLPLSHLGSYSIYSSSTFKSTCGNICPRPISCTDCKVQGRCSFCEHHPHLYSAEELEL